MMWQNGLELPIRLAPPPPVLSAPYFRPLWAYEALINIKPNQYYMKVVIKLFKSVIKEHAGKAVP